jgi:hypothetical protein
MFLFVSKEKFHLEVHMEVLGAEGFFSPWQMLDELIFYKR